MRTISRTEKFKKDYKREAKGEHRTTLDADLLAAISHLATDPIGRVDGRSSCGRLAEPRSSRKTTSARQKESIVQHSMPTYSPPFHTSRPIRSEELMADLHADD